MRFAMSPGIVPDAWFQLRSEGVRFSSKEEEERHRNKMQGLTVADVKPGRGRPEAPSVTEYKTEND